MERIERIREILNKEKLDGIIITSYHNIFYLSKFTSDDGLLLITKDKKYILSDFRYITQIKIQCPDYEFIQIVQGSYDKELNKLAKENNLKTIGFEGDNLSYNAFKVYEKGIEAELKNVNLTHLRDCKDAEEVNNITIANEIALAALQYVIKKVLKPGVSEKHVANVLDAKMKELGASGNSFDTIVASGERGALPHAAPTDKKIQKGELVTIDFGCLYNGYCSDITRTFAIKQKPSEELYKIYEIVREAQLIGIQTAKSGIKANVVDKAVRDFIASKGYGENFGHGTGHGVGILIHEAPRFAPLDETILEEGMVITVEPGIYIEGLGGVRIEDDILITKDGCEVITQYPKELIIVK